MGLLRCIRRLPTDFASALMVRRLALGRYEIGGRRTSLLWRSALDRELLVYEEEIQDPDAKPVPLFQYLREAASVAVQIKPLAPRALSFTCARGMGNVVPVPTLNVGDNDRYQSMQLACAQAKLRAQSADKACHLAPLLS